MIYNDTMFGVQIINWTPEVVKAYTTSLIVYLSNTSSNKKELNACRKACRKLIQAFSQNDEKGINEGISISEPMPNLNKFNSNYIFYNNLKNENFGKKFKINEKI